MILPPNLSSSSLFQQPRVLQHVIVSKPFVEPPSTHRTFHRAVLSPFFLEIELTENQCRSACSPNCRALRAVKELLAEQYGLDPNQIKGIATWQNSTIGSEAIGFRLEAITQCPYDPSRPNSKYLGLPKAFFVAFFSWLVAACSTFNVIKGGAPKVSQIAVMTFMIIHVFRGFFQRPFPAIPISANECDSWRHWA